VILAVVHFMRHRQRKSVRKAHPTGDVSGGEFYAPPSAEIGAYPRLLPCSDILQYSQYLFSGDLIVNIMPTDIYIDYQTI
jgi:hypothetical protein